ncbi:MAG: hypothetical protein WBE43_07150, partial [Candidatus Acidiferrales bacterium]
FHVTQGGVPNPQKVSEQYSDLGGGELGDGCLGCVNENRVYLEFAPAQLGSGVIHIDVTSPEGKTVSAEFDLDQLK